MARESSPDNEPGSKDEGDRERRPGHARPRDRKPLIARNPNAALAVLLVGGVTVGGGVIAAGYLGNGGWTTPAGEAAAANVGTVSAPSAPGGQPAAARTGSGGPGGTAPTTPGGPAGPITTSPNPGGGRTGTPGATPTPSASSLSGSPAPTATTASPTPSFSASWPSASNAPSPSPSGTAASGPPTPTPSATSGTPTPTATQTPPNAGACSNPVYTTSSLYGTYTALPYYVANNMWNVGTATASQTLSACSGSSWNVDATISGGGAGVKTYPNSHINFDSPPISSLTSVTSTFADSGPDSGTYEDAYDIWLNGIADPAAGSDELMIWTSNHGQTPGGSPMATVELDGQSWTAWKGDGGYMAFVDNSAVSSGTLNLLAFFQWVIAKGWVPADSTLSQVGYGVEIVSTGGAPATFSFSNFGVSAS